MTLASSPRALLVLPLLFCLACPEGADDGSDGGSDGGTSPTFAIDRTLSLGSCLNAGALAVAGDQAFVACGGDFSGNGELVIVDLPTWTVEQRVAIGGAPGSVTVHGDRVYLGDMLEGQVLVAGIDGSVIHDASDAVLLCPSDFAAGIYQFVPDVEFIGETAYATCFSTDEVVAFRVSTGADPGDGTRNAEVLDRAVGGDGLSALEPWNADDLVGLENLAGTAGHIAENPPPLHTAPNYWVTGDVPNDLRILDGQAFITNSGSNTLQVLDLSAVETVAEVPTGDGSSPWSLALLPDGRTAVTLQGTGEVALIDTAAGTVLQRVAMPEGAALEPFAGMEPLPRPQGIAVTSSGSLVVSLTNFDLNFAPAAPGMLIELTEGTP